MNRIIEFRVWDVSGRRMSDPFGLSSWASFPDTGATEGMTVDITGNPKQFQVMQFTGLLDKNGQEIFEGDVIEVDGSPFVVIFHNGQFGFQVDRQPPRTFLIEAFWSLDEVVNEEPNECSVIGNIYENADLIVKEQNEAASEATTAKT